MIVDALLFNQPDSAYYQKTLAIEQISFDILASPERPGIWLAGPELWDPERMPSLPLALVWKTSSQANGGLQPSSHGHIILSHESGKKTMMAKLVDDDKIPPPERDGAETPTQTKAVRERLFAGEMWWEADASLFGGRPGCWTAAVLCGGRISNAHKVRVEMPSDNESTIQATPKTRTYTHEELAGFTRTSSHFDPPENGVRFKLGLSRDGKKKPLLFGSYSLPEKDKGADILLNAFITGLDSKDMKQWSIILPTATSIIEGGVRKGWFQVDLEERLRNPRLEKFVFPTGTYLTFVYGSWFSNPELLDPAAFVEHR